jgi:hypothetical protein
MSRQQFRRALLWLLIISSAYLAVEFGVGAGFAVSITRRANLETLSLACLPCERKR